jgi:hypothetical protein
MSRVKVDLQIDDGGTTRSTLGCSALMNDDLDHSVVVVSAGSNVAGVR